MAKSWPTSRSLLSPPRRWRPPRGKPRTPLPPDVGAALVAHIARDRPQVEALRVTVPQHMWQGAGICRNEVGLTAALAAVRAGASDPGPVAQQSTVAASQPTARDL
jgi:hypothetical protein